MSRARFSRADPASRRAAGFTLIEIMIVVGIAALVMAMAVPFLYSTLRKDALRQAASDVMEACAQARAKAILTGVPAEVRFNPQQGTIQVAGGASAVPMRTVDGQPLPPPPATANFSAHLSPDVTIEMLAVNYQELKDADEARVRFFPNSTSDEFTMVLQRDQQQWRKISLEMVTGLADLETDPRKMKP